MPGKRDIAPGDWTAFRDAMPVVRRWAYFDHAAVAPISAPAQRAVLTWAEQTTYEGDTVWSCWDEGVERVRDVAGRLIGADSEEIALVPNTTAGISLVAEGFPWREGDNVVTVAGEFPSNLYPWMNLADRGVSERRVEPHGVAIDPNRIAEACDERTRIVAVSWVGYATGWRIDVAEMARVAHDRGALLFLDAIQGLGVFPINVRSADVDFLAADGHKWMLGPEGAGLFYIRREHLDLLRPLGVGWHSVVHARDFSRIELDVRREAARYEGGSQNMVGFLGLGASLELLSALGLTPDESPLAERVLEIGDLACGRLSQIGAKIVSSREGDRRSGIISFELPGKDPMRAAHRCTELGVALSCRGGRLRISPHAYTNEEDVDRLIEAL